MRYTLKTQILNVALATMLLACLASCGSDNYDEIAEREATSNEAARLYRARDYDGLEALAKRLRDGQLRTESGTLKLRDFYRGIAGNALDFPKHQSDGWATAASGLDRWIAAHPNSPTPYNAKARSLHYRAATFRGTSFVGEVSRSDLNEYIRLSRQAGELLIEFEDIASQGPAWFSNMASTYHALGVEKDEYMQLIRRGLTEFPEYDQLYFSAVRYLDPRWYGSEKELEEFALWAVDQTRDTRGHELYARIYWSAGQKDQYTFYFQTRNANWNLMAQGMKDIVREYPTQWNINHFAWFSCYNNDHETARFFLGKIIEPIIEDAWVRRSNYDRCKSMLTSP